MLGDLDGDAAHAAHFVEARCHLHANAQLLLHALLQVAQVIEVAQVLQALQQALLLAAVEQQDAQVRAGRFQQLVAAAVTGAGRAGLA